MRWIRVRQKNRNEQTDPRRGRAFLSCVLAIATYQCCSSGTAQSAPPNQEEVIERLAAEPGAVITRDKQGVVDSVQLERNGVSIRSVRQGSEVAVVGIDHSGHGAVLCVWSLYIDLRSSLDTCFPGQYRELRDDLDAAIAAMNLFIATNSLAPTSKEALEAAITEREEKARAAVSSLNAKELAQTCASPDLHQMVTRLAGRSRNDRQKTIAELLSVPRPPVSNPCL